MRNNHIGCQGQGRYDEKGKRPNDRRNRHTQGGVICQTLRTRRGARQIPATSTLVRSEPDHAWRWARGSGVSHPAPIRTRRVLPPRFPTSSSSQPMIFCVIPLTPPGWGSNLLISSRAWQSKLGLLLSIPAVSLLIAKRDALAPFVSTAFQSFWRHPNAVQSTVPLEGLDLVPQGLQLGAKRLQARILFDLQALISV